MSEFLVRSAGPDDLPAITECWQLSFGDPPDLIRALLTEADLLSSAVAAEADGSVRSVMFAFDGLRFGGLRTTYLYALCTHPDARSRGMGRTVLDAIIRQSFSRGAEMVFLSPADPALERWYLALGMQPLSRASSELLQVAPDGRYPCVPVGAEEYAALRTADVGIPLQMLRAQEVLNRSCGGGFFRVDMDGASAAVCAEPDGSGVLIRELCCPGPLRPAALRAVAGAFGCTGIRLLLQSDLVYITVSPVSFPGDPLPAFVFPLA